MKLPLKIVSHLPLSKVTYYSLRFIDEEICETEKFKLKFQDEQYHESLATIEYWLAFVGEKRGAKIDLFRKENQTNEERHRKAKALPPNSEVLNTEADNNSRYVGLKTDFDAGLRLYCIVLSDSVVILYNGSWKTAQDVRDCLNCYPYFKNINSLSAQLYAASTVYEIVEKRIKHASLVDLEAEKL